MNKNKMRYRYLFMNQLPLKTSLKKRYLPLNIQQYNMRYKNKLHLRPGQLGLLELPEVLEIKSYLTLNLQQYNMRYKNNK